MNMMMKYVGSMKPASLIGSNSGSVSYSISRSGRWAHISSWCKCKSGDQIGSGSGSGSEPVLVSRMMSVSTSRTGAKTGSISRTEW